MIPGCVWVAASSVCTGQGCATACARTTIPLPTAAKRCRSVCLFSIHINTSRCCCPRSWHLCPYVLSVCGWIGQADAWCDAFQIVRDHHGSKLGSRLPQPGRGHAQNHRVQGALLCFDNAFLLGWQRSPSAWRPSLCQLGTRRHAARRQEANRVCQPLGQPTLLPHREGVVQGRVRQMQV